MKDRNQVYFQIFTISYNVLVSSKEYHYLMMLLRNCTKYMLGSKSLRMDKRYQAAESLLSQNTCKKMKVPMPRIVERGSERIRVDGQHRRLNL